MKTHLTGSFGSARLAGFLLACCVLVTCGDLSAEVGRTVYYQITFADGNIRDESNVPATNANIRMVLRIGRIAPTIVSYEVITTHNAPLTRYDTGRTIKTELKWNGKAWVAPADELRKRLELERRRSADAKINRLAESMRSLLLAERKRQELSLRELTKLAAEAEKKLVRLKGTDREGSAAEELLKVRAARRRVAARIGEYERTLGELRTGRSRLGRPMGKVVEFNAPAAPRSTTSPKAGRVQVPPHRVQVWKLPSDKVAGGRRTYEVRIPHPEAGAYGSFYYVAYADTDGDGKPDRLIGRSPLAVAGRPGAWTNWRFETDYASVFVGNAWTNPNTSVYTRPAGSRRGDAAQVYVSPFLGAVPNWQGSGEYWPYFGSIQVYVENPNTPTTIEGENRVLILDRR